MSTNGKSGRTVMVTNCQRRRFILAAAPLIDHPLPKPIDPGETIPVEAEYWEHVWEGGKNAVLAALVNGGYLRVGSVEEAARQGAPELKNPDSPETPDNLLIAPQSDKVTLTKTRSRQAPSLKVSDVDK